MASTTIANAATITTARRCCPSTSPRTAAGRGTLEGPPAVDPSDAEDVLEADHRLEDLEVGAVGGDDLEAHRHAVGGEARVHGAGWVPGEVEGVREAHP